MINQYWVRSNFNILNGTTFDDVPLNGDFYWLLTCLVLCTIWITFIIYYNSRIFGLLLTKFINHFLIPRYLYRKCNKKNHPYLSVGSFSITLISGKIMFRDLVYISSDFSIRIQDGWIIFKWWVPYEPKNISKNDFSQSDTRLKMLFNGFEFHLYNRSQLYSYLEKVFSLSPKINIENNLITEKILKKTHQTFRNEELIKVYLWRDFFPVTKLEINSGRIVFGNYNVPTTLLISFDETNITYTSKPAISKHDLFTHIAKGKAQSFKIILANSLKYTYFRDEPPRFMGEGFVIFQSNHIDFYYYQDEPGFASSIKEEFELSTGDIIKIFTSPVWGLNIKSGKGTDIRYGPWADRQREYLYNFFYPPDFQEVNFTEIPKEKELRLFETFDFCFSTLSSANIDILFTDKKKETNVIHVNAGSGSYFEVSIPLISKENGYCSKIIGQILHLESTTTLAYRSFAESETLEFNIEIKYPRIWNHHQTWVCNFTGCKSSINLIFAHKIFFQSLIEDWAGKDIPDIIKFVPYTCKINLLLKEFEIILLANEYNWIDCTSKIKNENIEFAICGDTFDMAFDLPFTKFLPNVVPYKIWVHGESLEGAIHVPEINSHYETIKIMHKYAKLYTHLRNNNLNLDNYIKTSDLYNEDRNWRNITKSTNDWITCWSVPIVAISITYYHHPVPSRLNFSRDSNLRVHEINKNIRNSNLHDNLVNSRKDKSKNFDPNNMEPDLAKIEIEIGPSKICLYGLLLRALWNIKENYMGESQLFTDFSLNPDINQKQQNDIYQQDKNIEQDIFDERLYRPFAVTVSVIMHDLHGHLIKNCFEDKVNNEDPLCSYVYLKKLCFEMDKTYRETKLQLLLSPVILQTNDLVKRFKNDLHLNHGYILMNSLQFRGHALFSGLGRSLDSETLEYGWLVEFEIGKISGKLTMPQMYNIICSLENFVFQFLQEDSSLQPPIPYRKCLHDKIQLMCPESDSNLNKLCPYSEDLKYKMFRVFIQSIDLYIVEKNNLLHLQIIPIKLSTCNLHSCHSNNGFTLLINNIFIKHLIIMDEFLQDKVLEKNELKEQLKNKNLFKEIKKIKCYETLSFKLGPLFVDTSELLSIVENYTINQKKFLSIHDAKTKKLWFLWQDSSKNSLFSKCGCVGGCAFFGNNINVYSFFNLNQKDEINQKFQSNKLETALNEKFEQCYNFKYGESLLNPGESLLEFKLNSIYEKSEENIENKNFNNINKTNLMSTNQIKSLLSKKKSDKFFAGTKSISSSNNFLKKHKFTSLASSIKSNINFTNTLDNCSSNNRSYKNSKFLNKKNRSLSETGIEINSKLGFKFDKLSKVKESLPINLNIDNNNVKTTFFTTSSIATDCYFSAEEISENSNVENNISNVQSSEEDTYKSFSSLRNLDTTNESLLKNDCSNSKKNNLLKSKKEDFINEKKEQINISSSSSSFISACSIADESNNEENFCDLTNQMEKPILESPLLISTYKKYLTVYECDYWYPKYEFLNLINNNYVPTLKQITFNGLSSISLVKKKLVEKKNNEQNENSIFEDYAPGHVYEHISEEFNSLKKDNFLKTHKRQDSSERVINLGKLEKQICKTVEIRNEKITVLIKLNGDTELRITPLCLDGMKVFVDALTSTLSKAHPLTIINHLNLLCCKNVERKNCLKKEKTLEYGQLKLKAWRSTIERERGLNKNSFYSLNNISYKVNENSTILFQNDPNNLNKLINNSTNINSKKQVATVITANQYEETKNTKYQLFIQISNINIYVLQASLVENIANSLNVDYLNNCTCVSLLAMNIGQANFDFYNNKKERRSLHTFITNNAQTPPTSVFAALSQRDIMSKLFPKKPKKEQKEIEPLTIETQELLQEEFVGLGNVIKLHTQLNRLKNSSIINNAFLTIIPKNDSRVDFEIKNILNKKNILKNENEDIIKKKLDINSELLNKNECSDNFNLLTGFIMFEAGIENINLNCVKKKIVIDDDFRNQEDIKKDGKFSKQSVKNLNQEDEIEDLENSYLNKKSENSEEKNDQKPKNDASSLGGEIEIIWFNFAAPPKTTNTKKIDFTELDWNLISTATPAINAWLNSGDRLLVSSKRCSFYHDRRLAAVLSCLMSAALEIPGIHVAPKNRYWTNRLTSFSKALHEDPSCQLMAVLRRFLSRLNSLEHIEKNLNENVLPPLKILRKGVISLCRQWKNALYMPLLVEQNIKYNRGEIGNKNQTNIPLRLLINENNLNLELNDIQSKKVDYMLSKQTIKSSLKKNLITPKKETKINDLINIESSIDKNIDESYHLISNNQTNFDSNDSCQQDQNDNLINDFKNKLVTSIPYVLSRSTRGSLSFPLLSNPLESLNTGVNKAYEFLFNNQNVNNKNKISYSNHLNNSEFSNEEVQSHESDFDLTNIQSEHDECCANNNLYLWTLKHQDYMNSKNLPVSFVKDYNHINNYSKNCTLCSNSSDDNQNLTINKNDKSFEEKIDILPGFVFMPTGIQLGDVKVIFEPLLVSLNIENIEEIDSNLAFEQLGPKIFLSLIVKLFKIEIVESEHFRNTNREKKNPNYEILFKNPAAFECDYLIIKLDLRKVKNFENTEKLDNTVINTDVNKNNQLNTTNQGINKSTETEKMSVIIVGPEGDINLITTIVNFIIKTNHIIQRVNLPLLRLIHQVLSVFENVKETRLIMKSNKVYKWKQSANLSEKALSSSFDSSKILNRQSQLSNVTNKSVTIDNIIIDIDSNKKNFVNQKEENKKKLNKMPKCWKNMYYLLDLYETTPETKTVTERNSYIQNQASQINQTQSNLQSTNNHETVIQIDDYQTCFEDNNIDENEDIILNTITPTESQKFNFGVSNTQTHQTGSTFRKSMVNVISSDQIKTYTHVLMQRELTPFVIFGIANIEKVNLEAKLSGLKLDGELSSFHVSITHKEKVKGASIQAQKWKESSLTAHLKKNSISILEEIQPNNQQLVVKVIIGKSSTLISSQNKKGKNVNLALLNIGEIGIDIPQHPVALHSMMTRNSKQLSTTFQEFKTNYRPMSKHSSDLNEQERQFSSNISENITKKYSENLFLPDVTANKDRFDSIKFRNKQQKNQKLEESEKFITPIAVQFTIFVESFKIGAFLLPSLSAQYSIGQILSSGITGHKAKFTIDFREHILSLNTKLKKNDTNLPSSALVSLPLIHVSAEYMDENRKKTPSFVGPSFSTTQFNGNNTNHDNNANKNSFLGSNSSKKTDSFSDGIVLRKGSYLNAFAEIGSFEHSLTTDLLNHLLLVQKVFMKEINEILQKMSGYDKNLSVDQYIIDIEPDQLEKSSKNISKSYLLFNLHLTMKGIQITTTTPTNSAVRLETGAIELQLSNRVQNMLSNSMSKPTSDLNLKLYFKLQVDLNLALGQLFMNPMFEEADPEFQQMTYFRTRIVMRNALKDELISSTQNEHCDEKEAVLIVLNRPLLFIQPLALDKAVLVWLNYKNAYEYWNEQIANLNTEMKNATQQVFEKTLNHLNSNSIGKLFLQLTIDDLGICLPITCPQPSFNYSSSFTTNHIVYDSELKSAFVITLESTSISACSFGSWVSKAKFTGLCIRFVDDFETSLDDWKPDPNDLSIMNLCVVSEGTYEICSKTTTLDLGIEAKWLLNVSWRMEGFDIHVDTSIGKQLTSLFKTLTALTGEQNEINSDYYSPSNDEEFSNNFKLDLIEEKKIDLIDDLINNDHNLAKKENTEEDSFFLKETVFKKLISRDTSLNNKKRSKLIEKELNDQIKLINSLKNSKALETVIEQEIKKFNELEAVVLNDFKRDVINKLRRQSIKKPYKDSLENKNSKLYNTISVPSTPLSQSTSAQNFLFSKNEINLTNNQHKLSNLEKLNIKNNQYSKSKNFKADSSFLYSLSNDNIFEFQDDQVKIKNDALNQSKKINFDQHFNNNNYIQKPNIDFELDVKIFFNSGKCVLHTKDLTNKDDILNNKKSGFLSKDKSFTNNPYENNNQQNNFCANQYMTCSSNKFQRSSTVKSSSIAANVSGSNVYSNSGLKPNSSTSKLRSNATGSASQNLDYTIFLIPGLDIKLHYNSKTVFSDFSRTTTSNHNLRVGQETIFESENLRLKKFGTKKATCYAWMTLHSIPEETLITPHLLDFLEQALEPIPMVALSRNTSENNLNQTSNENKSDLIITSPVQYAVYGSFPVDVIVYLHVKPSVLRFSCLPTSRMECLLRLPSVDLVFSSKRTEDELSNIHNNSFNLNTHKRSYSAGISAISGSTAFNNNKTKNGHRRINSDYRHKCTDSTTGGLIITGYLVDFSLYIFHPYTNKKNKITDRLFNTSCSSINSSHSSSFSNSDKINLDRKDSLSLQVEFVKINISRSRKIIYTPSIESLKNSSFENKQFNQKIALRFSGLCDIGSASFKCDIRRSIEILDFPKAWYRKALWKRMFLGDQSLLNDILINDVNLNDLINKKSNNENNSVFNKSKSTSDVSDLEYEIQDLFDNNLNNQKNDFKLKNSLSSNNNVCVEKVNIKENKSKKIDEDQNMKSKFKKTPSSDSLFKYQQRKQLVNNPWETLILFDLNLSKLKVHMNIGNVMGNTNWITKEFRSDGKILIDSTGHRSMNIGLSLDSSTLDAKSGIVGGQIELSKMDTILNIKEYYGLEPDHVLIAKFNILQTRVDYMGTSILMMRMSDLDLNLKDEWKIDFDNNTIINDHPTKRPALMFIHCYLKWDQLQILMSKSTTPDLIKIICKLDEFFSQQFHSGKRIFSSIQYLQQSSQNQIQHHSLPTTSSSQHSTNSLPKRPLSQLNSFNDVKHHRHWQKALKAVSGVFLNNFPNCLPKIGTVLGGTFELYGNNLSLACFSGVNFRSKSWALFSLRHPHISFQTEAQESLMENDQDYKTHIIQNFTLSLGRRQNQKGYLIDLLYAEHSSMATVCKISTNTNFSPQFKYLNEWFEYAFCVSALDEVYRFPIIEFERLASDSFNLSSLSTIHHLKNNPNEHLVDGIGNVAVGVANVMVGVAAAASSSVKTLGETLKKHRDDYQQRRYNASKTAQLNHNKEIIFALPSLQLELKTEHIQDSTIPLLNTTKPKVDCAFVTDFDDHIFVAVNLEAYYFLHTLITSYLKEKEIIYGKIQSPVSQSEDKFKNKDQDKKNDETEKKSQSETDWREYNCKTWHLEPTVRLLTWAGKNIDSYGVDFILQRLGFTQARTTIPKWIQRGAMDPLDRVLSELMYRNILSNKNNNKCNK